MLQTVYLTSATLVPWTAVVTPHTYDAGPGAAVDRLVDHLIRHGLTAPIGSARPTDEGWLLLDGYPTLTAISLLFGTGLLVRHGHLFRPAEVAFALVPILPVTADTVPQGVTR